MVTRFPNMISIIYSSIKTKKTHCEVPINNLCIKTLRLLRERNLIFGFNFVSQGMKTRRLYPRVKISLKFPDKNSGIITDLRYINNRFSNFHTRHIKLENQQNSHKKVMITTPKGLFLCSINEINKKLKGKMLLEISY